MFSKKLINNQRQEKERMNWLTVSKQRGRCDVNKEDRQTHRHAHRDRQRQTETKTETDRQTDRLTDRQQTGRQAGDCQTDKIRWANKQVSRPTVRRTE